MNLARRRRLAGLAAIGAVALVAGCGGGSDDSSSASASATAPTATVAELSADEFRSQANSVCADAQDRIDAVPDPETPAEIPTAFQTLIPIAQERLDKLRALDPPAELQGQWDEALGLGEKQIALAEQISDRVNGGEEAETVFAELEPELTANEERSNALAAELGVEECASDDDGGDTTATTGTGTAAPDTTDSGSASGETVQPAQYLDDVQAAAGALSSFGTLLQSVSSADDLKSKAPQARKRLDEFDAAIAKLDTYTLDDARLERQRAGLARTGPRVSQTLRDFTAAASEGDLAEIQRLVPQIRSAIGDFQSAATDVG